MPRCDKILCWILAARARRQLVTGVVNANSAVESNT
jgi:hypothetical protein